MSRERRWDPCVAHRGIEVNGFLDQYFAQGDRKAWLIAGAGFDPRSGAVAARLSRATNSLRALFVRERRPNPPRTQFAQAEANTRALLAAIPGQRVEDVDIFGPDGAVIGGRSVINVLRQCDFGDVTDLVVDISALSAGTGFPLIRYFVEGIERGWLTANLHVFVVHDPRLDAEIRSIASDAPGYVHGFKGRSTLSNMEEAAKLWLPLLATGRRAALARLYDFVRPDDTCPILPFPASHPRVGDLLAEEYLTEIESAWSVDPRNIVYADEGDPLDIYRTILTLDDLRKPVFSETGGSMLVLSPLGSKVMALGILMAALELDLPVAHVESINYELEETAASNVHPSDLMHVWLEGDVYPQPRPMLQMGGTTE